jgi:hypothetical protein
MRYQFAQCALAVIVLVMVIHMTEGKSLRWFKDSKSSATTASRRPLSCLRFVNATLICPGLFHQQANLKTYVAYTRFHGFGALIAPVFCLDRRHNRGREVIGNMSDYFDLGRLHAWGHHVPLLPDDSACDQVTTVAAFLDRDEERSCGGRAYKNRRLGLSRDQVGESKVYIPFSDAARSVSRRVSSELSPFVFIHARRGDKLHETANCTSAESILEVLRRLRDEPGPHKETMRTAHNVYIAHNERDYEQVWAALLTEDMRREWNVVFFSEVEELRKAADDNFMLYAIEQDLKTHAAIRISTFTTTRSHYHASLCSLPGYL